MTAPRPDVTGLSMLLGAAIRDRREARGLSQADVASYTGMSRASMTQAESGHQRLPLETLYLVAAALECEVADLLPPLSALQPSPGDIFARLAHDPNLDAESRTALGNWFRTVGA